MGMTELLTRNAEGALALIADDIRVAMPPNPCLYEGRTRALSLVVFGTFMLATPAGAATVKLDTRIVGGNKGPDITTTIVSPSRRGRARPTRSLCRSRGRGSC